MRGISLKRPSPALVIACVALGIALGGTGYATVLQVPKNSVGTAQLKSSAVTNGKLAPNAVTSAKVRNRSLLRADFAAGQLPAGPAGPTGPAGPAGPPGVSGIERVESTSVSQLGCFEDCDHHVPGWEAVAGRRSSPEPCSPASRAPAVVPRQRQRVPSLRARDRGDRSELVGDGVRRLWGCELTPPRCASIRLR